MNKYNKLEIIAPVIFAFVFICTFIFSYFEPHIEDVTRDYERVYAGKSPRAGMPGGHIPGAISFPIANLRSAYASSELAEAGVVKENTIILYCNTGADSGRFADALIRSLRFSPAKIKNYRGSVMDWIKDPDNKLLPPDHDKANHGLMKGK